MRRQGNKLTAAKVRAIKQPGLYSDGFNLCLQVKQFWSVEYEGDDGKIRGRSFDDQGLALAHQRELLGAEGVQAEIKPYATKSWIYRYWRDGKDRKLGLGSAETTTLARARELAQKQRELLREGVDPIGRAEAKRAERKIAAAKAVSFRQASEKYIEAHRAGWRNAKHAGQWSSTLATFAYPVIGDLPVQAIDTPLALRILEPIWNTKNETASRLRGRIESILDWAKVRGLREGENPARWKGHLDHLLPAPGKVQAEASHHSAMSYRDLPRFIAALRAREGATARALEFAILTAARAGEAVGARWSEIDLEQQVWVIPPSRMKAKKEHRVPLSDRALALLEDRLHGGELVFEGVRIGQLLAAMRDMGEAEATVHGFRSSFRDWAAESTSFPAEIAELALAHSVGSAVERAYRRTDLMERRRRLMSDWATYCESPPAERGDTVVAIRERA
jgi:integrase